jgi:hypothetical protein
LFKTEYKTALKVIDAEKNVFGADETFLNAYRDIYTDKACKPSSIETKQYSYKIGNLSSILSVDNAQEFHFSVIQLYS